MAGTKSCKKCGNEYSKKQIKCPKCGEIDERRALQIIDLELKVYHHPELGLCCKKCGTLFPNDIPKCTYCATAAKDGAVPVIKNGKGGTFVTPMTKYRKRGPYIIKPDSRSILAAKIIENATSGKLTKCNCCNASISSRSESCPHCGNPTGVHVCPNCNGINTKVISGTSKATSIFLWGAFAANKVVSKFECKDCGHRF